MTQKEITLPELYDMYLKARISLIQRTAARGLTQTEAAKVLNISKPGLNRLIKDNGIHWPVIRQGNFTNHKRKSEQ